MKALRLLLCLSIWVAGMQIAHAGIKEPKPVYPYLYMSVYEQSVLLNAIRSNKPDELQLLLSNATGMDEEKEKLYRSEIEIFSRKMRQKQVRVRDEKAFLDKLFYAVQRRFLKKYQPFQPFSALLQSGTYNCLSATALYALLLDELEISYQIYETDYHIFLMLKTAAGDQVLFETTDPMNGFVDNQEEIDRRIAAIRNDELAENTTSDRVYAEFGLQVFRPVSLQQLAGLQYYNQAAYLYNNQRIEEAALALSKGRLLYQAERFNKLAGLLAAAR